MRGKTAVFFSSLVWISLVMAPAARALQGQDAGSMPEGEGKKLVADLCTRCHAIETVVSREQSPQEWEETVADMISRGAQVPEEARPVLLGYLTEHFGRSGTSEEASPGEAAVMKNCFQCHGDGLWKRARLDRRAWEGVIYRMIGRDALWTEQEIDLMADYLAKFRGPAADESR